MTDFPSQTYKDPKENKFTFTSGDKRTFSEEVAFDLGFEGLID